MDTLTKAKHQNWNELSKEEWWTMGNLVLSDDAYKEYQAIIVPKVNSDIFACSDKSDLGFENWYLVEPETICRWTGLHDKNKEMIFEKDIVYISSEDENFLVEWDHDTARFVMNGETITVDFDNYYSYEVEVIGNIFDDPKLLKKVETGKE